MPKESAAPWAPLPCTVNGGPPSASAMLGDTKRTDKDSRNVCVPLPSRCTAARYIDEHQANDCDDVTHSALL